MVDFAAEVLEALRRAGLTPEAIRSLVREEIQQAIVAQAADKALDVSGLAQLLGISTAAAKMRAHRDPGLARLAFRIGTRRRWMRRDVLAWMESHRKVKP